MRAQRLFQLLGVLHGRRQPISANSLAQMLAVSLRTLYRDMATLQEIPHRGHEDDAARL